MYKRITTNIVEEHFDHPMAAKIKAGIDKKSIANQKASRPTTEIFDRNVYRENVTEYFEKYIRALFRLSDAIPGTDDQLIDAFESTEADELWRVKYFFHPFYQAELGSKMANVLGHMVLSYTMIIHMIKVDFDDQIWVNSMNAGADGIAGTLSRYSHQLDFVQVRDMLRNFNSHVIQRARAIKTGNLAEKESAEVSARNSLMFFKEKVVDAIIQQHPDRFLTSTTV